LLARTAKFMARTSDGIGQPITMDPSFSPTPVIGTTVRHGAISTVGRLTTRTLSVFLHFVGPSLFPNNQNMKTFIMERVSHIPADGVAFYMKGTWELSKELELGIVDGLGGLMRNC
jgi:hypothetical protein